MHSTLTSLVPFVVMMMVVCYDDDVDGVMVMVGVVVAGCGGDVGVAEVARGASVIVDRVDPEVGSVFGVGRKNPAGKVFISFKGRLHNLLDKVVSVGTAPGPNSSDHNVNTITNGDGILHSVC
ncbi:hypothetical protein Tco_1531581 [Tanacetum coccineum]